MSEEKKNETGAPPPPPDKAHIDQARAMAEELSDMRIKGRRTLFLSVMLMFLVSIVVFVIGTYFFVIPRIVHHDLDMRLVAQKVSHLEKRITRQAHQARVVAPAPAPVADPAPPAPADEPKKDEAAAPKADAPAKAPAPAKKAP